MPRSKSSSQISLRRHWPLGRMAREDLLRMVELKVTVTHYHSEWQAFEVKQRCGRSLETNRIFVPLRYANPLRLLNAKIAFFGTVLETSWKARAKKDTKHSLERLKDAMGRNLWFEHQTRNQFFTE